MHETVATARFHIGIVNKLSVSEPLPHLGAMNRIHLRSLYVHSMSCDSFTAIRVCIHSCYLFIHWHGIHLCCDAHAMWGCSWILPNAFIHSFVSRSVSESFQSTLQCIFSHFIYSCTSAIHFIHFIHFSSFQS